MSRTETAFDPATITTRKDDNMETPKIIPSSGSSNGTWGTNVDQAQSTAHDTIDKVSQQVRPSVDRLSEKAHQTVDRLSGVASQAASSLSDKASQYRDLQGQWVGEARDQIRERPVAALAVALAAGFVLRHLLFSR
jgi:ElaB/YqjD/DUF883 family membrane-anchored ribosome-binding protein